MLVKLVVVASSGDVLVWRRVWLAEVPPNREILVPFWPSCFVVGFGPPNLLG